MGIVLLKGFKCERCGHEWIPREKETPRVCPRCKSPYWNVPRKQNNKNGTTKQEKKQ